MKIYTSSFWSVHRVHHIFKSSYPIKWVIDVSMDEARIQFIDMKGEREREREWVREKESEWEREWERGEEREGERREESEGERGWGRERYESQLSFSLCCLVYRERVLISLLLSLWFHHSHVVGHKRPAPSSIPQAREEFLLRWEYAHEILDY